MKILWLLSRLCAGFTLVGISVTFPAVIKAEDPPPDPRLQKIYQEEAVRWQMWVGPDQKHEAEMVQEPVFRWQNLVRNSEQSGALFVWLHEGRPVVIGGVFSFPERGQRVLVHEFHALGPDRLYPVLSESKSRWRPDSAITLTKLPESVNVDDTISRRTLQMRAITRDFTAKATDLENRKWELRALPKPLYRYEKPQGNIIDGALIAFVSDAGTDPEIILILEARQESGSTAWYYRPVRLSISDLYVDYKGERAWTSMRFNPPTPLNREDNPYRLMRERLMDELPRLTDK